MSTPGAATRRAAGGGFDEEHVASALRAAALPPLLAALAHATGDHSILRDDLRPDPTLVQQPTGGLSAEQRAAARALALDVLRGLTERPPTGVPTPSDEELGELMAFVLGQPVSDDYLPLLVEELATAGDDLRTPEWRKDQIDTGRRFLVAVVGAGMSGLLAGHRLGQAGVDYVVIEKNDDVGGTWLENCYPGCRVDVPNHLYSYSFAQRHDWPDRFSPRDVLLDYFRRFAEEAAIRAHIRFRTEVVSAAWDDAAGVWRVRLRGPDGDSELEAHALISAVGQLNRPLIPDIEGRESFAGPAFHSAQWDAGVELEGRRVAVVGTGASGFQIIPEIASRVGELFVFQRTPNWFLPTPDYREPTSDGMRWLFEHVPYYSEWYRFWLFWRLAEGALPAAAVDPGWRGGPAAVSELNDALRAVLTGYLEQQFATSPDLLPVVVPRYPPLAKRILLDDGTWARALTRPNVHLVSDAIDEITPTGITTVDGTHREVDVIVYATGFQASKFLTPMEVHGRDGLDLHEAWGDDARAYLGMTIPGFPNFFCLYGPNTNLVANGSIIFFSECEVRYVLGCLRLLLERRARSLECRRDVHDAYNVEVDEANRAMVWGAATVNSWYKNAAGRVTQNWPHSLLEFWRRTREPDPGDFVVS